jgi:glycosyltransferase involved in cell wall biosynthesis
VQVIPMGVSPASRAARNVGGPRYFLALGSVEVRKNLSLLRRAFDLEAGVWRREGIELWVVGQAGYGGASILAELARGGSSVKYLGPQSARALAGLMRNSLALCAPSLAEGFGLPPLEALAMGTPVLASDIPAHREVLGEAAELLPPTEPEAWSAALLRIAGDSDLRAQRARRGRAQAAEFTWIRTARQTEALYREVLGEEQKSGAREKRR